MHAIQKYGKTMKILYPGELYVSSDDEIIATVLGSCISVCLYDSENAIAGMNHFMLPGKSSFSEEDSSSKYGITAIKELIRDMYSKGAKKNKISARIFGGGNVVEFNEYGTSVPVSHGNIRLARVLVELEDIPIVEEDIGGKFTRKVVMEVKSGKIFLKKTSRDSEEVTEEF